jgi:hypothetical protein
VIRVLAVLFRVGAAQGVSKAQFCRPRFPSGESAGQVGIGIGVLLHID